MDKYISIPYKFKTEILACGGDVKASFALAKRNLAFIRPIIGDLKDPENLARYEKEINSAEKRFSIRPQIAACDLHPEYLSTKFAKNLGLPLYGVQHHHAHMASCMAENGFSGEAIGVSFDGTGFGLDGAVWGGEFLIGNFYDAKRAAHLEYVPMPGGEAAILEVRRMAMAYLYKAFGKDYLEFADAKEKSKWRIWGAMIDKNINSPLTSSSGRLFDAVGGLAGICDKVNYEAEAAIKLEKAYDKSYKGRYEFYRDGDVIKTAGIIRGIAADLKKKKSVSEISSKFHNTMINIVAETVEGLRKETKIKKAVLSGGVFQNKILLKGILGRLKDVCIHSKLSPSDTGISLGQAVVANARYKD